MRTWLLHVLHIGWPLAMLCGVEDPRAIVAVAVLLFFGLFTLFHDVLHGALGLGRKTNDAALTVFGALVLASGNATRLLHLRHHARPFADDDLEARGARGTLLHALVRSPGAFLELPLRAFQAARGLHRRRQVLEWVLVVATFATALTHPVARLVALTFLALQLTIPVWGARLPHAPPAWLVAALRPFAWTMAPMVRGLLLHERHHERPRVASYELV